MKMIIFNFVLLILVCFCAKTQAETCTVGTDGCSWDCVTPPLKPGEVRCKAILATPTSCEIGSSDSLCGTTCTCSKAKTCKVGVEGCLWTCNTTPSKPGHATCFAIPATPDTCVPCSKVSSCGTTCTCSQEKKCTVGVNGCKWTCETSPPPPGVFQCLAYPATPSECYPGEKSSLCGTTCTCSIEPTTFLKSLLDALLKLLRSIHFQIVRVLLKRSGGAVALCRFLFQIFHEDIFCVNGTYWM